MKPIVLLTNDDGIQADGLQAMRRELAGDRSIEVHVVAPDRERSATGHAITVFQPLNVDEVAFPEGGRPGLAITGTPADCTKLAVKAILPRPPALVISGINRGPNLGSDVFYSGTVSAAIEGAILDIPSIAVSLAAFENADYAPAARIAHRIARTVLERGLPRRTLLNVNIPALPEADIAGTAVVRLGIHRWDDSFDKRLDPRGKTYYWLVGHAADDEEEADTDVTALRNNMVAITPITLDLTHYDLLPTLREWGVGGS